jgi:hypothetical protein
MKREQPVREEDVARALQAFLRSGGMIRKLPNTATPRLAVVGSRYGQFENPREQLFSGGAYFSG